MDDSNAIELRNVSKKFKVRRANKAGGTFDSRVHTVLDGISFDIKKSEVVGLIGQNGSGKSTLLKIISGILISDGGSVEWSGEVASILELGSGFDPNFSGRENIYMKCSQYGFSDKEIDSFIEEIIEFSGLGDEIDDPLRTYSSGMAAKLALPTILYLKRDIMIFDEILSVGDAGLGAKCNQIFRNLKNEGKTIIIASHNLNSLQKMCDRIVWIDDGKIKMIGAPAEVCSNYEVSLIDSPDVVMRGAKSGDTTLQNRLGEMYRDGINVEKDLKVAEYWFSKASNLGFVKATMNLASLKVSIGDLESALGLYYEAAELGEVDAYMFISALNSGNNEELIKSLVEKSSQGNMRAMALLAECYQRGIGTLPDGNKAFYWFESAAKLGDVVSCFQCGMILRDGKGVDRDISKAVHYLTMSAIGNYVPAVMELAKTYLHGIGVGIDVDEGVKWLSKLAFLGNVSAMLQLGNIYKDGLGVEKNDVLSKQWFNLVAQTQIGIKEWQLADLINKNNSLNYDERIRWLEKASESGNQQAMFELALILRDGKYISADIERTIALFKDASSKGHVQSMIALSHIYSQGVGVGIDMNEAFVWMTHAANCGNYLAEYELGMMYLCGMGVKKDVARATQLFKRSAEQGYVNSKVILGEMTDG